MKKAIYSLVLAFFLLAVSHGVGLVSAQEEQSIEPQAPQATIVQRQNLDAELAEVRRTYSGQLAEYRQAENQFTISKGQFTQLNTLSSLEVAVQDFREVMSLRDQVLLTYLKLIELELLNTDGINLEEREIALETTRVLQQEFQAHKDLTDSSFDRSSVNNAADEFAILRPRLNNLSQYATVLIQVGRLQNVYDKANSLVEDTDPEQLDLEQSVTLNELIRAHNEIETELESTNQELRDIWVQIRDDRIDENRIDANRESLSVYAGLSQVITYLNEFLR